MDGGGSPVGVAGTLDKYDALVEIRELNPDSGGETIRLVIESPIRELFAALQDRALQSVLEELSIRGAVITVHDNHALDFVLRARTAAAAERLRAQGGRI